MTGRDEDCRPAVLVQLFAEGLRLDDVVGEHQALTERHARQEGEQSLELQLVLEKILRKIDLMAPSISFEQLLLNRWLTYYFTLDVRSCSVEKMTVKN